MNALQVNRSVTPAISTDLSQTNSASSGNLAKPSGNAYAKELVPSWVADLAKPAAPVAPAAPAAVPPSASAVYVLPKAPNTSVVPAAPTTPTAPTAPKAPTAPEAPAVGLSQADQKRITDALTAESKRGLKGGNKDNLQAILNTEGFKILTQSIVEATTLGKEQAEKNYKLKTQQLTDVVNAVVPGFNGKPPALNETFGKIR
jgi:hypothetical protein